MSAIPPRTQPLTPSTLQSTPGSVPEDVTQTVPVWPGRTRLGAILGRNEATATAQRLSQPPSILASTPSGAGRPQASPWQKASPLVLDRVGPTYSHVMATSECVKPTQDHVVGSLDRVNSTLDEPLHEPAHVPQQSGNGRSPSHVQTRRARAQVLLSRDPRGFVKGCLPTRSPPCKDGAGTPGMEPTLFREPCAVT